MGADGHIVICKRADFEAANPDVRPEGLGLYTGEVLGVEACWGYFGDNLFEPNYLSRYSDNFHAKKIYQPETRDFREATPEETERLLAAADWFDGHAEEHEVWT